MSAQEEGSNVPGLQNYVLTDEEQKVVRECRRESFWFRAVPASVLAMAATHSLVSKGILSTHTRFGSLPKVAFAGFLGFASGHLSYIKVCRQKIMKLENSPLAEMLRQKQPTQMQDHTFNLSNNDVLGLGNQMTTPFSRYSKPSVPMPEPPSTEYSSEYKSRAVDVPFSTSMSESSTTGISDNLAQEPEYEVEEQPKSPPVTYEELRNRNREPHTSLKPIQNRTPRIGVKKNKYGDVWED